MNKKLISLLVMSLAFVSACAKPASSSAETSKSESASQNTSTSQSASTGETLTEIKFVKADFPASSSGYPADQDVVKAPITLSIHNVMASQTTGASYAQMKRGDEEVSYMRSSGTFKAKKLVIEQYFQNKGYDGTLTVLAGADAASATEITATDSYNSATLTKTFTYTIEAGAAYFALENRSAQAYKAISIDFFVVA
jgi:hypothetical protein